MLLQSTEIVDTFAEAFKMWAARVVITAASPQWADAAARSMTGFATSVIGCKCEAGIEGEIPAADTPDRRPGVSVLLFAFDAEGVGKRLVERIGQCVLTCPTTACFNGLETEKSVVVGGLLRYFGDGYQISKLLNGRRIRRIPVMDGEFVIDERFGVQPAIGGGNILISAEDSSSTLRAAQAAVTAMRRVPGVILPFPDGVVRSGSKPGSRYKSLLASTNEAYCPTLRGIAPQTNVPPNVGCVLEIVIDGLDLAGIEAAMRCGIQAAVEQGAVQVSAGNYGGKLGQYQIALRDLLDGEA